MYDSFAILDIIISTLLSVCPLNHMGTYQFAFTLAPIMESYPSLAQFDDMNDKELI